MVGTALQVHGLEKATKLDLDEDATSVINEESMMRGVHFRWHVLGSSTLILTGESGRTDRRFEVY